MIQTTRGITKPRINRPSKVSLTKSIAPESPKITPIIRIIANITKHIVFFSYLAPTSRSSQLRDFRVFSSTGGMSARFSSFSLVSNATDSFSRRMFSARLALSSRADCEVCCAKIGRCVIIISKSLLPSMIEGVPTREYFYRALALLL